MRLSQRERRGVPNNLEEKFAWIFSGDNLRFEKSGETKKQKKKQVLRQDFFVKLSPIELLGRFVGANLDEKI